MTSKHDAVDLLMAEHAQEQALFEAFRSLCERDASDVEKSAVAEEICLLLSVRVQLERDIFYPPLRQTIGDDALLDEGEAEHVDIERLIARISALDPSHALYDVEVTVLGEIVDRHAKQAQGRLFTKARQAGIDLVQLGTRMKARELELLAGYRGMLARSGPEDEAADPVGPVTSARTAEVNRTYKSTQTPTHPATHKRTHKRA